MRPSQSDAKVTQKRAPGSLRRHAGETGRMDATPDTRRDSMPRLASERAWHTPLLIVGAVLLLVAVYATLLWVVAEQTPR